MMDLIRWLLGDWCPLEPFAAAGPMPLGPNRMLESLALDGAAVVVVSEPTRDVSLALDGDAAGPIAAGGQSPLDLMDLIRWLLGRDLVPAGAVRRRWADRRCGQSPLGPNRMLEPLGST